MLKECNSSISKTNKYLAGIMILWLFILASVLNAQSERNHLELTTKFGGGCLASAIRNNFIYLGEGSTLVVMDITNPANPVVKAKFQLKCMIEDIKIEDTTLYAACREAGLAIIDITNPVEPRLMSYSSSPKIARRIAVIDHKVFIADYYHGVKIIDCSDPYNPQQIYNYSTGAVAQDICVIDGKAYIANDNLGLYILDVSNPQSPSIISSFKTLDNAWGLFVKDSFAYIAASGKGLQIIDISDPENPVHKGQYKTNKYAQDVFVSGGKAYLAASTDGLIILNVENASTPVYSGKFVTNNTCWTSIVENDIAFISNFNSGLHIVDVSSSSAPGLLSNYKSHGYSQDAYADNNYLFIADGDNGTAIVDISNPENPVKNSVIKTSGYSYGVFTKNNMLFIASGTGGIYRYDVSDAAAPMLLGSYNTNGTARKIIARDNYAYVADGANGLLILDISETSTITPAGNYNTNGTAYDLYLQDNYCFVADGTAGMEIFDISNPSGPILVGFLDTAGDAKDIFIQNQYAYVADTSGGVRVIDISNITAPSQVKTITTNGVAEGVSVLDNNLYVAETGGYYASKMEVFDISSPTSPIYKDSYFNPGMGYSLNPYNGSMILSHNFGGVFIFKYHNEEIPAPTPTPSPVPTSTPEDVYNPSSFDSWTTGTIYIMDPVSFYRTSDKIQITTTGNNQFGYWQYPDSIDEAQLNSLYFVKTYISSDADQCTAPAIRLRTNSENFEQADVFLVNSISTCSFSPSTFSTPYSLVFEPRSSTAGNSFLVAVDVMNIGTTNFSSTTNIDSIEIYRSPKDALSTHTLLKSYTFEDSSEGWTHSNPMTGFSSPVFSDEQGALAMTSTSNINTFGFWNSPLSEIKMESGKIFKADFLISSPQNISSDKAYFRARLSSSDNQIISTQEEPIMDIDKNAAFGYISNFNMYIFPPQSVTEEEYKWITTALDLVNINPKAPIETTIRLEEVDIYTIDAPWYLY